MSLPLAFEIASFSSFSSLSQARRESVLLLFADERGKTAAEVSDFVDAVVIRRLAESESFRKERFAFCETLLFSQNMEENPRFSKIILVNLGEQNEAKDFSVEEWLKLGGVCCKASGDFENIAVAAALPSAEIRENALAHFICGFKLRNYRFDKYKTEKKEKKLRNKNVTLWVKDSAAALKALDSAQILADSVILARDLVNEPANVLGTEECLAHIRALTALGVDVEILDKEALERAGLRALLAVAQGSKRPPYLAVLRWNGGREGESPVALVGKGVVFDSGGISLKPSANMEEMKGDMGGAAAVVGAFRALAGRKAKANIVGIIGLVENMPDAQAQRPGDIITSLSGQTIEVINTDAEGRLVLADALWFAKEKFKPRCMVDFATLTGAVCVALGEYYAGLYANNSALSANLVNSGNITGEPLWPMPLDAFYDKKLDSRFADMRNSCGRDAGSITAAQFLQRFVGDTPWAHIDIAGVAFGVEKNEYNRSWATGFGVRLLDYWISQFYENSESES